MKGHLLFASLLVLMVSQSMGQGSAPNPLDASNYGLVYQIPAMKKVRVDANRAYRTVGGVELKADYYYPPRHRKGDRLPVVIFCNGVGDRGGNSLKDWEIYKDWGRLAAAKGFLGVTYQSRSEHTEEDLAEMVKSLAERGMDVDADGSRVAIWSCSANVGTALPYLMNSAPANVRCAVVYYGGGPQDRIRSDLPIFYVKSELDGNQGINALWPQAMAQNAPWNFVVGKGLPHAFDGLENSDASRAIVAQTMDFLTSHLQPLPDPVPDSDGRKALAKIYGNRPAEAIPHIEALVRANPKDDRIREMLADCLERGNLLDRAEEAAKTVLAKDPNSAQMHSILGKVYFKQKRYAESAAETKRSIELGFDFPGSYNGLGLAYLYLNENEKAIEVLKVFETRNIPMWNGHYNLACAYARVGQKEKALAALAKVVELGYTAWRAIEADEDFASIRSEPQYKSIIERLKANSGSPPSNGG